MNTETTTGAMERLEASQKEQAELLDRLSDTVDRVIAARDEQDRVTQALVDALEGTVCRGCNNRIGFKGDHRAGKAFGEIRWDWRTCTSCQDSRAALALVERTKEGGGE